MRMIFSSDGLSPTLVLRYCPLWESCVFLEAQVRGFQGSLEKSGSAEWEAWGGEGLREGLSLIFAMRYRLCQA